ncbi:MAG: hypothetical protein BMS9Abin25_0759 [Gammaproteobacteria bacterium]|nr:MAG: hypothetical protein BMS9Abin25_0759 [Gammaproteobacteria bacterium]
MKTLLLILAISVSYTNTYAATAKDNRSRFDDKDITVVIGSRTPEQLAAFYTGRDFNQASIDAITKTCFVFGMVKNKNNDVLWLILDDWKFFAADGSPIKRIKRNDWAKVWQQTDLSQAHQSTFGWTQLPESRDLRQHESVGGNVVVKWQDKPFKLIASFSTGADKSGQPRTITVENLTCTSK